MRDPTRIDYYISLLKKKWEQYPDWRFGQLLCNFSQINISSINFFYVEDEDFFKCFESESESFKRKDIDNNV